jgi:Site-specific recombinase XerD
MRSILKIRPYPQSQSTPWLVAVPKKLTHTMRVRKYFHTYEEAEAYIFRVLAPGIGYEKADVRYEVTDNGKPGPSVVQCAHQWMQRFINQKPMFFQARQLMRPLIKRFGHTPISNVSVKDLDAYLRSLSGKYSFTTMSNYWRRTRQFFTFCHNFGWIAANPMMNPILKQPVRREKASRYILKPEQMARLLAATKGDSVLTAYLCLGGFAGIRTEEIFRMDWDDLLWDGGEIRVMSKKVATTGAKDVYIGEDDEDEDISGDRLVTMELALRRHLEPIALKGAQIDAAAQMRPDGGHGSRKVIPGGQRTLYLRRAKLREVLGLMKWPKNCLRHSYKSYHAAYYRDLSRTQYEMGHSDTDMTRYKYGAARMHSVAEAWWAL